jgi:hypothetical protein
MMRRSKIIGFFILVALAACAPRKLHSSTLTDDDYKGIDFAPCSPLMPTESLCSISPTVVHPTQFALSFLEVEEKRERLKKIKDDPEAIDYFLRKKIVPGIKGPESVFYIVDGHHTARALAEESILVLYLRITKDYSALTPQDFLARLRSEGLLWLYDENGVGPQDPAKIPLRIMDLKDDVYRSLAEDARKKGAFDEKPVYFQQFIWANYFRKLVDKSLVESDYKKAIGEAVKWARHPNASELPGFKG